MSSRAARMRHAFVCLPLAVALAAASVAPGTVRAADPADARPIASSRIVSVDATPDLLSLRDLSTATTARPAAPNGGGRTAASVASVAPTVFSGAAGVSVATAFPGWADAQYGCPTRPCDDPNSMVAANGSRVVQVVDAAMRISILNGVLLEEVALPSFLGMPSADIWIGDSQIVYDGVAGRWTFAGMTYSCSTGRLYLAVSASSDPRGSWAVYRYDFAGSLPYLPRLGISSSMYAIGYSSYAWSNCAYGSFEGGDVLLVDGAAVRAGATTAASTTIGLDPSRYAPVPAVNLQPGRLEVVAQSITSDGDLELFAVAGSAAAPSVTAMASFIGLGGDAWDLSAIPIDGFAAGESPIPSGPVQLVTAGSRMVLAGNTRCDAAGGLGHACVRVAELSRSEASTSLVDDFFVADPELDLFSPTIASLGGGDRIGVTYISNAQAGSWAVLRVKGDPAGTLRRPARLTDEGAALPIPLWTAYPTGTPSVAAAWVALPTAVIDSRSPGAWRSRITRLTFGTAAVTLSGSLSVEAGRQGDPWRVRFSSAASGGAAVLRYSCSSALDGSGALGSGLNVPIGSGVEVRIGGSYAACPDTVGTRTLYYQWGDGAGAWSSRLSTTVTVAGPVKTARWAGADRFTTAVAVSQNSFPSAGASTTSTLPQQPGVPVAVVATGMNFPDALSGGAAAGHLGGPLLLVPTSSVPGAVVTELGRLKPQRILVIGSSSVVSDAVARQLAGLAPAGAVRLFGPDRYATAVAVSSHLFAPHPDPNSRTVFVATGLNYPDALAASGLAGYWVAPILTVGTSLSSATANEIRRLRPANITILGSSAAVSSSVETALKSLKVGYVSRLAGRDRYATAMVITSRMESGGAAYAATGVNFPDALAASAVAYRSIRPMLLVTRTSIPEPTRISLSENKRQRIFVLGGTPAIDSSVQTALGAYATGP